MNPSTIAETATHRLNVEYQPDAEPPDFDFQGQIIEQESNNFRTLHHDMARESLCDEIAHAWHVTGGDLDIIERYLRIFFDVADVGWFDTRNARFFNVVTNKELKAWGFDSLEDYLKGADEHGPTDSTLKTWMAWADGEVFGYVIEEKARFARLDDYDRPILLTTTEEWVEVDSCWGYYGDSAVEQAGREAFSALTGQPEEVDA